MKDRETISVLLRFIFLLAIVVVVVPDRTAKIVLLSAVLILGGVVAFLLYKTRRTDGEQPPQDNTPQYKVEFDDEKPAPKKKHKKSGKSGKR